MKKKKSIIVFALIAAAIICVWLLKQHNNSMPENKIVAERIGDEINMDTAISQNIPTIVYFGSECCSSNRDVIQELNQTTRNIDEKASLVFFNSANCLDLVKSLPVKMTPFQLLYDTEGNPFQPSDEVKEKWKLILFYNDDGSLQYTAHEGSMTEEQMEALYREMGAEI